MKIKDIDFSPFGKTLNTRIRNYCGVETIEEWQALERRQQVSRENLGKKALAALDTVSGYQKPPAPPTKFWHSNYYGPIRAYLG